MAEITLHIAGRHYAVRCRDGEEAHLAQLAAMIEGKARDAQAGAPGMTEVRSLLFAALFLADEVNDLRRAAADRQAAPSPPVDDEPVARMLDALATRVEKLAGALAARGASA